MKPLTENEFKAVLPAHIKKTISKELIDGVNQVLTSPDTLETLRDNIVSYTSVMQEGKFSIKQYLNAVHYVSHKLLGASNRDAYLKTFPDKYTRWKGQGITEKVISAYVSGYNKTKLVNLIYAQTLVPVHVLNADIHQQAINAQADLMMNARSEMVRSTAANSLMIHLKPPESTKIELDVTHKTDDAIDALRATTAALVKQQKEALEKGIATPKQIAEAPLVLDDGTEVTSG